MHQHCYKLKNVENAQMLITLCNFLHSKESYECRNVGVFRLQQSLFEIMRFDLIKFVYETFQIQYHLNLTFFTIYSAIKKSLKKKAFNVFIQNKLLLAGFIILLVMF